MDAEKMWAKSGAFFLAEDSVLISGGTRLAVAMCAELARSLGMPGAENIAFAAKNLSMLEGVSEKLDIDSSNIFRAGDAYLGAMWDRSQRFRGDQTSFDFCATREAAKAELRVAPKEASSIVRAAYLKVSSAITKSHSTSVDAGSFQQKLSASHDIAELGQAMAAAEPALRELNKTAKSNKGSLATAEEREQIKMGLLAVKQFGKKLRAVPREESLVVMSEKDRFAPQKGYAAFLPERAQTKTPEGFWGSNNCGGMDLGAAKLFESPERAKSYFERGGFGAFTLVEVEMRIRGIVPSSGGDAVGAGLASALAENEKAEIDALLAKMDIESVRARLAELEAAQPRQEAQAKKTTRL